MTVVSAVFTINSPIVMRYGESSAILHYPPTFASRLLGQLHRYGSCEMVTSVISRNPECIDLYDII